VVPQSSFQKMKGFLSRLRRIFAGRKTWGCMAFQHRERRRRRPSWVKLISQKVFLPSLVNIRQAVSEQMEM
jgi:hypothetical protein